jgi:hypothetical protein
LENFADIWRYLKIFGELCRYLEIFGEVCRKYKNIAEHTRNYKRIAEVCRKQQMYKSTKYQILTRVVQITRSETVKQEKSKHVCSTEPKQITQTQCGIACRQHEYFLAASAPM